MLAKLSLCICAVACLSLTAFSQEDCEPISRDNFLRSFELGKRQRKTAGQYIEVIYRCGVNFPVTPEDAQEIRRVGRYLGKRGLDDLIDALRQSLRVSVPWRLPGSPYSYFTRGTILVGINTGARAHVLIVATRGFQDASISLHITNDSKKGTITNIGFIVRPLGRLKSGKQINGPGNYELFTREQSIEMPVFTARSSFSLETTPRGGDPPNFFKKGFTESGIPPGQMATFRIVGNLEFLGIGRQLFKPEQLERGVVVWFQDAGENHENDLALFPELGLLYSSAESLYQIRKMPSAN